MPLNTLPLPLPLTPLSRSYACPAAGAADDPFGGLFRGGLIRAMATARARATATATARVGVKVRVSVRVRIKFGLGERVSIGISLSP